MGGYMKGHGIISSNRGGMRSYGLMVIIAFGAAIIGILALQKLRERRIFNLLVKEKDRQLFSLQILLQKERDYAKETKRETEEMKSKLYSLRAQKADLDGRVLEMQSIISSLKDEQKAMETSLEEKQNEIKVLREKETDFNKESPQLISLTETLKQKEAEIEDLKNRFGAPVKVWSVSADDPSNPPVNLTLARTDENEVSESGNNSTVEEDGRGNESKGEEEESRKSENSMEVSGKGIEDPREGGGLGIGKEERKENGTEGILKSGFEVQSRRDEASEVKGVDSKELGVKLEMADRTENGGSYKGRGNRARKGKGKRWRKIGKKENLEENEVASVKGRRFFKDALESERKKRIEDGEVQKMEFVESKTDDQNAEEKKAPTVENTRSGEKSEESELESKSAVVSTDQKEGESSEVGEKMSEKVENGRKMEDDGLLQKQGETEDGENASKKVEKGKEMEIGEERRNFPGELPLNRAVDVEGKQKLGEVGIKEEKVDNEETEEQEVEIQESD